MQAKLLRQVLLPKLPVSEFSHGGVRGRHIKTNVEKHMESRFVFTADVSDFYPTISHNRVYRFSRRILAVPPTLPASAPSSAPTSIILPSA